MPLLSLVALRETKARLSGDHARAARLRAALHYLQSEEISSLPPAASRPLSELM